MENNKTLRTIGLAIASIFSAIIVIGSLSLVPQMQYLQISVPYYMTLILIDVVCLSIALILSFKGNKIGALVGLGYAIVGMFTAGINVGNIGLCVAYTLLTIYYFASVKAE